MSCSLRWRPRAPAGTAADAARVAGFAPESIVRWVLARLVAQGEDAKQLASAFAVLDAGALSDAALLAGLEPRVAAGAADALIAAHILSAERPLPSSCIHSSKLPCMRRSRRRPALMRTRAARLMAERGAPSARVAAHMLVAEPAHDLWVVEVLRGAAREASVAGSPGSAASYLERALAETPPREVREESLLELGEAELQAGLPGAARHMREALDVHPDPRRRAEISLTLGRALFSTGDYPAAAGAFRLGLDEVKDGDDDLSLSCAAGTSHSRAATQDSQPSQPSGSGSCSTMMPREARGQSVSCSFSSHTDMRYRATNRAKRSYAWLAVRLPMEPCWRTPVRTRGRTAPLATHCCLRVSPTRRSLRSIARSTWPGGAARGSRSAGCRSCARVPITSEGT